MGLSPVYPENNEIKKWFTGDQELLEEWRCDHVLQWTGFFEFPVKLKLLFTGVCACVCAEAPPHF